MLRWLQPLRTAEGTLSARCPLPLLDAVAVQVVAAREAETERARAFLFGCHGLETYRTVLPQGLPASPRKRALNLERRSVHVGARATTLSGLVRVAHTLVGERQDPVATEEERLQH